MLYDSLEFDGASVPIWVCHGLAVSMGWGNYTLGVSRGDSMSCFTAYA